MRFVTAPIGLASFDSRGGLYIVRARDTALFTTESVARTIKVCLGTETAGLEIIFSGSLIFVFQIRFIQDSNGT